MFLRSPGLQSRHSPGGTELRFLGANALHACASPAPGQGRPAPAARKARLAGLLDPAREWKVRLCSWDVSRLETPRMFNVGARAS